MNLVSIRILEPHPLQIPADDCMLLMKAIIVHFQKIIFKKRLPILERKFTFLRVFSENLEFRVLKFPQPYYEGKLLWDSSSFNILSDFFSFKTSGWRVFVFVF